MHLASEDNFQYECPRPGKERVTILTMSVPGLVKIGLTILTMSVPGMVKIGLTILTMSVPGMVKRELPFSLCESNSQY